MASRDRSSGGRMIPASSLSVTSAPMKTRPSSSVRTSSIRCGESVARTAARRVSVRSSNADTRSGREARYLVRAAESGSGRKSFTNAELSRYTASPFIGAQLHQDVERRPLAGQQRRRWVLPEHLDQIAPGRDQSALVGHPFPPVIVIAQRNDSSYGPASVGDPDGFTRRNAPDHGTGVVLELAD